MAFFCFYRMDGPYKSVWFFLWSRLDRKDTTIFLREELVMVTHCRLGEYCS